MLTLKIKPIFQLAALNSLRTVSVDATVVNNVEKHIKSFTEIPGPPRWPIIGQAHHFFRGGELYDLNGPQMGEYIYNKYGPIVKIDGFLGKPPTIFLFDAEESAHILRSENLYPKRPGFESLVYYKNNVSSSESKFKGLVADQGEVWKQFRSTVNPVLLQPKTIKLYTNMIDEVARDMIARLKSLRRNDNTIQNDFETEMNLWSLESIALIALGRRLRCFDPHLASDSLEKRIIHVIQEIMKTVDTLDFKPSLWRYYSTRTFKHAMKLFEEQEKLAANFIDKTIEELQQRKEDIPEEQKSVLEKLLEINRDIAIIMATDVVFAGVDTTSNTTTASLYLLANNQEKQDMLRKEILSTNDDNTKRPYLKACLKESMRMMPVAGGNARVTTKEYNVLGYKVPIGIHIVFMHQTMSMMEEHYPRAKEYLPERWLAKKGDPLFHGNAHPFANQPFGFGVRSCIGRRIAELELETFLARLIENFKVEWFGAPVNIKTAALNYVKGPYNFIFKDV